LTGTPDNRVVPEHDTAGRASNTRPNLAAGLGHLQIQGLGRHETLGAGTCSCRKHKIDSALPGATADEPANGHIHLNTNRSL